MEHGQEMDGLQLQKAARDALEREGVSQSEAARKLEVSRPAVTMALNHDPPSRYAATLRRIIEAYTDFCIETETKTISTHRAKLKSST